MIKKLMSISAVVLILALLLTLAPACGNGDDEEPTPGATPTPGVTPTPGATPTPTPEAKTFKFGMLTLLSGFGAQWGMEIEDGVEWAKDKINDAGGFKVGADTYMIKIEKGDTMQGSVPTLNEVTRMIYDEGINYILGPILVADLIGPVLLEGKCFSANFTNHTPYVGPHNPYQILCAAPVEQWYEAFWDQAYRDVEIDNVIIVMPDSATAVLHGDADEAAHLAHGTEVLDIVKYPSGTADFYPVLTKVVAKNPDCVDFDGSSKGDIDLMIKQIRELGYEGLLAGPTHGDPQSAIDIAGAEYAEGFICNDPNYGSDVYPEAVRQLYAEFQELNPGRPLALTTVMAYSTTFLYVQLFQAAGSTDPDEVMKVLDDPNFEFTWFGQPGKKLGGIETVGIRRIIQDEVGYSEVIDGKKVMLSRQAIVVP